MASSFQKLKDLDLSRDEVHAIGEALKNEEFRKLLVDYVEEVRDPENRKLYEQEITQLEKERGVDVTFINPSPGYVIKTSVDGSQKCFINVSTNEHIGKASSAPSTDKAGGKGFQWSIPHSLAPPREDIDNKSKRCQVFDVVFHPETVQLAKKNRTFYNMLNNTACDAVEKNFHVKLDRKNLKFPKLQYKGLPNAAIIRKPSKDDKDVVKREGTEKDFFDKIYSHADGAGGQVPTSSARKSKKVQRRNSLEDKSSYTTPKYEIKHRSPIDIQETLGTKDAKINAAVPRELVVEVNLPLLKCSGDITLDVTEKTVQVISEKPAKYKLNLTLPYRVSQDSGNAKFDKDQKKLIVTLPVKRNNHFLLTDYSRDDSGVESDHGSPTTPEALSEFPSSDPSEAPSETQSQNFEPDFRTKFLDKSVHYTLPEFTCHVFENTVAFTLNVKNVDDNSVAKLIPDAGSSVHIKFTSTSASFFPTHYAFYVDLLSRSVIIIDEVSVETWDNNVTLQIPLQPENGQLKSYKYGVSESELSQNYIEEPSIINAVLTNTITEEPEECQDLRRQDTQERDGKVEKHDDGDEKASSTAINIAASSYESSGDELSCSFSPSKGKGILKRLSSQRYFVGRSISESSLDDFVCSSVEMDPVIPEDNEMSTSLKKTVRFNDVIMKQLYRSNSSILGQKKKNQRKARNKKRAQERRHSESETSEMEDKKDDDEEEDQKNGTDNEKEETSSSDDQKCDCISDIFHMDMNF